MLKPKSPNRDPGGEPAPAFATDAEIDIAAQLRNKLEQRYLGPAAASPPVPAQSSERR